MSVRKTIAFWVVAALLFGYWWAVERAPDDAKAGLEQVAKSEAIDLVEVSIARDLLASYDKPSFKLPTNVVVP